MGYTTNARLIIVELKDESRLFHSIVDNVLESSNTSSYLKTVNEETVDRNIIAFKKEELDLFHYGILDLNACLQAKSKDELVETLCDPYFKSQSGDEPSSFVKQCFMYKDLLVKFFNDLDDIREISMVYTYNSSESQVDISKFFIDSGMYAIYKMLQKTPNNEHISMLKKQIELANFSQGSLQVLADFYKQSLLDNPYQKCIITFDIDEDRLIHMSVEYL